MSSSEDDDGSSVSVVSREYEEFEESNDDVEAEPDDGDSEPAATADAPSDGADAASEGEGDVTAPTCSTTPVKKRKRKDVNIFVKRKAILEYEQMEPKSKTKICAKFVFPLLKHLVFLFPAFQVRYQQQQDFHQGLAGKEGRHFCGLRCCAEGSTNLSKNERKTIFLCHRANLASANVWWEVAVRHSTRSWRTACGSGFTSARSSTRKGPAKPPFCARR